MLWNLIEDLKLSVGYSFAWLHACIYYVYEALRTKLCYAKFQFTYYNLIKLPTSCHTPACTEWRRAIERDRDTPCPCINVETYSSSTLPAVPLSATAWATLGGRFLVKFMSVMQSVCWSAALSSASEKLLKIITQKPRQNLTRCAHSKITQILLYRAPPSSYCCMQSAAAHLKYCSLKCSLRTTMKWNKCIAQALKLGSVQFSFKQAIYS